MGSKLPLGSAILGPLLLAATALALVPMPALLAPYPLLILCHMLVFAIACLALNLLLGLSGLLSLGHAAFYGASAYAGALLFRFADIDSVEVYLAFGVLFSTALGAAAGFLCVRVTKIRFTILTLAFSMVLYSAVISGAIFRLFGDVGWAMYIAGEGSMYLPRLALAGIHISAGDFIPTLYFVIAAAFLVTVALLWRIQESPFGYALRAVRDNDVRAAFIGIPARQYRFVAFVLSGLFMGVAGGLSGLLSRQITTDQLDWFFSAEMVLATVLGGTRYFLGPVVGAIAFVALDELTVHLPVGRHMAFGVLLIVVIMLFPQGIAGGWAAARARVASWRRA